MYKTGHDQQATVGTTRASILPADEYRQAVTFSCPAVATVTLSIRSADGEGGFILQPLTAAVTLRYADVGDWITREIFAETSAGTELVGMIVCRGIHLATEEIKRNG